MYFSVNLLLKTLGYLRLEAIDTNHCKLQYFFQQMAFHQRLQKSHLVSYEYLKEILATPSKFHLL